MSSPSVLLFSSLLSFIFAPQLRSIIKIAVRLLHFVRIFSRWGLAILVGLSDKQYKDTQTLFSALVLIWYFGEHGRLTLDCSLLGGQALLKAGSILTITRQVFYRNAFCSYFALILRQSTASIRERIAIEVFDPVTFNSKWFVGDISTLANCFVFDRIHEILPGISGVTCLPNYKWEQKMIST